MAGSSDDDEAIIFAAMDGDTDRLKALLDAGGDANQVDDEGYTPTFVAAQEGQTEALKLLIQAKADVNKAMNDGATPTFLAAQMSHTEALNLLIRAKADVNKAMNDGWYMHLTRWPCSRVRTPNWGTCPNARMNYSASFAPLTRSAAPSKSGRRAGTLPPRPRPRPPRR